MCKANCMNITQERKRAVTIHVADGHGDRLQGAALTIEQISRDLPIGSAIASTILGNLPYQVKFYDVCHEHYNTVEHYCKLE